MSKVKKLQDICEDKIGEDLEEISFGVLSKFANLYREVYCKKHLEVKLSKGETASFVLEKDFAFDTKTLVFKLFELAKYQSGLTKDSFQFRNIGLKTEKVPNTGDTCPLEIKYTIKLGS